MDSSCPFITITFIMMHVKKYILLLNKFFNGKFVFINENLESMIKSFNLLKQDIQHVFCCSLKLDN